MTPLDMALSQIGVAEATGANDGIPSQRYMGGRREPWCAHFVAWAFRQAGKPLPGDTLPSPTQGNPIALVERMEREARAAGVWLPPVMTPRPGDVALYPSRGGSDAGSGRHCGIVVLVMNDAVITVEANQANAVRSVRRPVPVGVTGWIRMA